MDKKIESEMLMSFLLQILGIVDTPNIIQSWIPAALAAATAIGGLMYNRREQQKADARNARQQKEFARHGIQWKIADAKRAGISPEFALGAQTYQASPTNTADQSGGLIADAGQNIARAALASGTKEDRATDAALKAETLRGMRLDNDIKETQAQSKTGFAQNPPFPHPSGNVIEGQGNSPVKDVALERTGMSKSTPHSEGGSIPQVGWAQTPDGGLRPVPSQDIKNRIEDQLVPETVWAAQNLVAPNIGKGPRPPQDALPPGAKMWRWSVSRQAWYPDKIKHDKKLDEFYKMKFHQKHTWPKFRGPGYK